MVSSVKNVYKLVETLLLTSCIWSCCYTHEYEFELYYRTPIVLSSSTVKKIDNFSATTYKKYHLHKNIVSIGVAFDYFNIKTTYNFETNTCVNTPGMSVQSQYEYQNVINVTGYGISSVIKIEPYSTHMFVPTLYVKPGVIQFSQKLPYDGTTRNYMVVIGSECKMRLSNSITINSAIELMHISNAHSHNINANSLNAALGCSVKF